MLEKITGTIFKSIQSKYAVDKCIGTRTYIRRTTGPNIYIDIMQRPIFRGWCAAINLVAWKNSRGL